MDIQQCHKRVITELCKVLGFKSVDLLLNGGKLRVNDNFLISFIYDEAFAPGNLLAYVDMGPPPENDQATHFGLFLKINFELGAGTRGTLSLHPQTGHMFYSFRYELNESASGQNLLESVLRFLAWFGEAGARAPTEANKKQAELATTKDAASVSRARASRIIGQEPGASK